MALRILCTTVNGVVRVLKDILTKDNICVFFLGLSLLACIMNGYSENVACTIGGSLGGAIAIKAIGGVPR